MRKPTFSDSRHSLSAGILISLILGALLMSMVPVMANNGDPVVLGEVNKAIRSTWVASRGPSVMKFANTLNGVAVELKTAAHVPPMIVHSSTKVDNLNADLLDGLDSSAFANAVHDHDASYAGLGHDHNAAYLAIDGTADDSDLLDGRDSAEFAGTGMPCPPGAALVGYGRSGRFCSAAVGSVGVDTAGDVGLAPSMVLDASGYPVISYYDATGGDLKVAHCNDARCVGGDESIATIPDPATTIGDYSSLVLDASGNPVIAYYGSSDTNLMLAHCTDPNCAGTTYLRSVDYPGDVGRYPSLALDSSGYPVIAYYDTTNADLKLAHCSDSICDGPKSTEVVTAVGDPSQLSLVLDSSGYPVISYYEWASGTLGLAHCNDPNCAGSDESIQVVDAASGNGQLSSLVLDSFGYPVISYYNSASGDLKVAHCNDPNCAGADEDIQSVDTTNQVGLGTSLLLDASGNPVVAYYDATNQDLRAAHCNDPNCAGGDELLRAIDTGGGVGECPSLALDASGHVVIAYYDRTNQDLKVAAWVD